MKLVWTILLALSITGCATQEPVVQGQFVYCALERYEVHPSGVYSFWRETGHGESGALWIVQVADSSKKVGTVERLLLKR